MGERQTYIFQGKTPTMGGLLIFLSVVVSSLLWAEPNVYVISALVVFLMLTIVGFLDDYLKVAKKNSGGLPGRMKLLGQGVTTLVVCFTLWALVSSSGGSGWGSFR